MTDRIRRFLAGALAAGALLFAAGCGGTNHLAEYDFEGRTVAVTAAVPPLPGVFTDPNVVTPVDLNRPAETFLRVGTAVAKEAAARRAEARMDSALARVDVAERLARRTLLQSARYLGYRPVNDLDRADFLLDIRVKEYGLTAHSWDAAVNFVLDAEVRLLDRRARRVVWKKKIRHTEPVTAAIIGFGPTLGNVFTAATLASLSVDEMERAFKNLADYAADRFAGELREDYYER